MTPNDAARSLLQKLALPYGSVSIMPWHEGGKVVIHVLVDKPYLRQVHIPAEYGGYDVKIEERLPAQAQRLH
jgi:hypothetical protein